MSSQDFSRRSVRRQLSGEGLRPKKGLGQNFLTDETVLQSIVDAAELTEDACALEIGPGMGVLTKELAKRAEKVTAVEIDTTILPVLQKNLEAYDNVTVVNQDILKVDLNALFKEQFGGRPVRVVANLPYYITTPILMKLLESDVPMESIVIMIQREVAQRLAAEAGSKDFGAITLSVQYRAEVEHICDVPPEAFEPMPKVWSSVIRLIPRKQPPVSVTDEAHFFRLIKAAFGMRRKTLVNALSHDAALVPDKEALKAQLAAMGLSETVRGECLSLEQFATLSNNLIQNKK